MYKYETHLHTCETSKCGRSPGAEHAKFFAEQGYTGIFVTDHFFNGNVTVPRDLPWEKRVELFKVGYDNAKEMGDKVGLDVFFGWEYSYGWAHFLTYNLGADWLLANPDLLSWSVPDYIDHVHEAGGFIFHAHPFRLTNNPIMPVIPAKCDGVEIFNAGRSDAENQIAVDFARSYRLPVTAGSDIHHIAAKRRAGVYSEERFATSADYCRAVIEGRVTLFEEYQENK